MSIAISTDQAKRAIQEFKRILNKDQIARGASVSINKTIRETKSAAGNIVSQYYYMPKSHLQSIGYVASTPNTLQAHLMASKAPISMSEFDKSESKTSGVTVKIKKGRASVIKYGFTIPGRPYVYARGIYTMRRPFRFLPAKKRLKQNRPKITRMVTLSVSGALANQEVTQGINEFAKERLPVNVFQELKKRLNKLNSIK